MTTHFHFIVWAWERIEPGTGNYINNTTIDLICRTSTEALGRARDLVPDKAGYAIRSVIEHVEGACVTGHG